MQTSKLTLEQCETIEEQLTQQAIDYANLIKTPQQRALAAKDVITGLPEKEITLAYKDGYRTQFNELSTEIAHQLVKLRKDCQVQHTDYADKATKDITSAKNGVSGLEKRVDNLDARTRACVSSAKDLQQKFYDHLRDVATGSSHYAERLRQNEKDVGSLSERKANKASVWLLAGMTMLQSAYVGFELARQPGTYAHQAYQAIKNVLAK